LVAPVVFRLFFPLFGISTPSQILEKALLRRISSFFSLVLPEFPLLARFFFFPKLVLSLLFVCRNLDPCSQASFFFFPSFRSYAPLFFVVDFLGPPNLEKHPRLGPFQFFWSLSFCPVICSRLFAFFFSYLGPCPFLIDPLRFMFFGHGM